MATTSTHHGHTSTYADCVSALQSSLSYLESSNSTLENGVADFPRLIHVLKTTRHYELIPQTTLQTAEATLRSELSPAITTLLDRADAHTERVERRIENLRSKAELQQGRVDANKHSSRYGDKALGGSNKENEKGKGKALDASARLRARVLKQRREALRYSVERLELEVAQKERELRKRLGET